MGTLSVDINLDLNDLPDTLPVNQWVDPFTPTRPENPDDWTYDGHVCFDELTEILEHDPSSLMNASGQMVAGLDAFAEVSIAGLELFEMHQTMAEIAFIDFDVHTPDGSEIQSGVDSEITLGTVANDGTLSVHAGDTAGLRLGISHETDGPDENENFRIRSLGETDQGHRVQVTYWFNDTSGIRRSYSQTFVDVNQVSLDSGTGNDELIAAPGTSVSLVFEGGSGNDYLSGGRILVGRDWARDYLNGGSGYDTLVVHRYWLWGWKNEDSYSGGERILRK